MASSAAGPSRLARHCSTASLPRYGCRGATCDAPLPREWQNTAPLAAGVSSPSWWTVFTWHATALARRIGGLRARGSGRGCDTPPPTAAALRTRRGQHQESPLISTSFTWAVAGVAPSCRSGRRWWHWGLNVRWWGSGAEVVALREVVRPRSVGDVVARDAAAPVVAVGHRHTCSLRVSGLRSQRSTAGARHPTVSAERVRAQLRSQHCYFSYQWHSPIIFCDSVDRRRVVHPATLARVWGTEALWFLRQIQRSVLTRDDVAVLLSSLPTPARQCALIVSCLLSAEATGWGEQGTAEVLLGRLPPLHRAVVVRFFIAWGVLPVTSSRSVSESRQVDHTSGLLAPDLPHRGPSQSNVAQRANFEAQMEHLLDTVLSDAQAGWQEALLLMEGLEKRLGLQLHEDEPGGSTEDGATSAVSETLTHAAATRVACYHVPAELDATRVPPLWVRAVVRPIVAQCGGIDNVRTLARALTFAELLLPAPGVAVLCDGDGDGATFEAEVYRSRSQPVEAGATAPLLLASWAVDTGPHGVVTVAAAPAASRSLGLEQIARGAVNAFAAAVSEALRRAEENGSTSEVVRAALRAACRNLLGRPHAASPVSLPPAIDSMVRDYAAVVLMSLIPPHPPQPGAAFESLRREAVDCALALLQGSMEPSDVMAPNMLPQTFSGPSFRALWRLHTALRLPSVLTAERLLSSCRQFDDLLRVVPPLPCAGELLALNVLKALQHVSPHDTYFVSVTLRPVAATGRGRRRRWCRHRHQNSGDVPVNRDGPGAVGRQVLTGTPFTLLFEAKPTSVWREDCRTQEGKVWRGGPAALSAPLLPRSMLSPGSGGVGDAALDSDVRWLRSLSLFAQQQLASVGSTFDQSRLLTRLLANVGEAYIPAVAASLPQLTSPMISAWIDEYAKGGRWSSALAVLGVAKNHRVTPLMESLVELLERYRDDPGVLAALVSGVQRHCPRSAATVFRAFVERAVVVENADDEAMSWGAALEVLSASSMLGITHYPTSCVRCIAEHAPSSAVHAVLALLEDSRRPGRRPSHLGVATPAPLELQALVRLVQACAQLHLQPVVDVFVASAVHRQCAWWSSHGRSEGTPVADKVFRAGHAGLWHVALADVAFRAMRATSASLLPQRAVVAHQLHRSSVHRALQLLAVGCDDARAVLRSTAAAEHLLRRMQPRPTTARAVRAASRLQSAAALGTSQACIAGLLTARGEWVAALRAVPVGTAQFPLPPVARRARLHAMACNPQMRQHALLLLDAESPDDSAAEVTPATGAGAAARQRRLMGRRLGLRTRQPGAMPQGVRRLMEQCQLMWALEWWDAPRRGRSTGSVRPS